MASRRGDAKAQVEQWGKVFEPIIGKAVILSFSSFTFPGVIIERIELAKTTGMTNAPDKRTASEDGKQYTPAVMDVITNAGVLRFVIEDTQVLAIANGVRIKTAANDVDLRIG